MNAIHRFLQAPLWVFLAVRLLAKPDRVIYQEEYSEYFKMYRDVMLSIRWVGRNWFEKWLLSKLVPWIDREQKAISKCEMQGIIVVGGAK